MEALECLIRRQSCRNYRPDPLSEEEITAILQAAMAAPVAYGDYSKFHLTVIQDPKRIQELERGLQSAFPDGSLYEAPAVCLVSSVPDEGLMMAMSQLGAGCIGQNILLAATALGLGSVFMGLPVLAFQKHPELLKSFGIPESYFPCFAVGFGHPDQLRERQKPQGKILVKRL